MLVYFYKYLHKRQQTNSKEQNPSEADSVLACQGIPPHFLETELITVYTKVVTLPNPASDDSSSCPYILFSKTHLKINAPSTPTSS
jgi:hypothetical protein